MAEKQAAISKRDVNSKEISDWQIESLYKKCTALYHAESVKEVVAEVRSHLNQSEFCKDPRQYIQQHFPWRDDDILPSTEVALLRYILCRLARLKIFQTDEQIVIRSEAGLKY